MALLNFHGFTNGKNENLHLLLFHCRYFEKSFLEMFDECPLPNMSFLSKPLNLIGCHDNQKAEFAKKYSKHNSEVISEIKLKLCRMFIALASTEVLFLLLLHMHFYCNLEFP